MARSEISLKPKETFRNVSILTLCAWQQAEPILMSTPSHCKSQQELLVTPHAPPALLATGTDNPFESVMLITTE